MRIQRENIQVVYSNSNPKHVLPTEVGMNRWKQETCVSAKSINSSVICYPLSLHKRVGEYGDETRTWYWRDLVVMERWCFLSVEGNLAPVKIFIFTMTTAAPCFVLWCHLTLTEARLFIVSMFTSISSLAVAGRLPASHSFFRSETVQTNQVLLGEAHHQSDCTGLIWTTTKMSSGIDVQTGSPTKTDCLIKVKSISLSEVLQPIK